MSVTNENWKAIIGNENYEVSDLGNVRRLEHTIINKKGNPVKYPAMNMKLTKNTSGYMTASVKRPGYVSTNALVHILIREAFFQDFNKDLVCDHINHDRSDNRIENLRVVSQRKNTQNRFNKDNPGASYNKISKSWVSQVRYNKELYFLGYFKTAEEASECYMNACNDIENGILPVKRGNK